MIDMNGSQTRAERAHCVKENVRIAAAAEGDDEIIGR
jgi:hypothetical protein